MANSVPPWDRISSGVPAVDNALGGLLPGDNVVWFSDDQTLFGVVEEGLVTAARTAGLTCLYVTLTQEPAVLRKALPPEVRIVDARAGGPYSDPAVLEQELVHAGRAFPILCVLIDGLDAMAQRWGEKRAALFFSRVCPRLFDLDAIAYWRAPRPGVSRTLLQQVSAVTQCVLELSSSRLRVLKAEGRPTSARASLMRARFEDGRLIAEPERALGRLARGLERLRAERHLSQSDIARVAQVSPSAISQAEAGRRGLSVDTLVLLAEGLGVSLDDLLAAPAPAGYVLGRREGHGRRTFGVTPLLDDPTAGLRASLVRLRAGERGHAPYLHKGIELVLVAEGLVQLEVGGDSPVMRAGDAALVTSVPVRSWLNLTGDPSVLFWIVRD